MAEIQWYPDNRPKLDGHYATINRKRHPTVIIQKDQHFQPNRIIHDLLEAVREGKKFGLGEIWDRARQGAYCKEEMHELYRLIGYSVKGFEEVFETDSIGSDLW